MEHKERGSKDSRQGKDAKDNKDKDTRRKNPQKPEAPKREAILDLNKYYNEKIRVRFIGGRQIIGVLKGFDQLMNLVLEDVEETLRDPEDDNVLTKQTRSLGKVVVRGPSLLTISPLHGSEIIDNPFGAPQ